MEISGGLSNGDETTASKKHPHSPRWLQCHSQQPWCGSSLRGPGTRTDEEVVVAHATGDESVTEGGRRAICDNVAGRRARYAE